MRELRLAAALALALAVSACAGAPSAPPPPASSTSEAAVQDLMQEYLAKFLTPATAYALGVNPDPTVKKALQDAEVNAHAAIFNAQSFIDAAPTADATQPLAAARAALDAAEATLPKGN
jgi:hypothetical protein